MSGPDETTDRAPAVHDEGEAEIAYSPMWDETSRDPLPQSGDERAMLIGYLDWLRATIDLKCAGLSTEQLNRAASSPSTLTLHGLVRHLAGVERWWFQINWAGREVELLHYSDDWPDADFEDLAGDPQQALATWRAECDVSRGLVQACSSLDVEGRRVRDSEPVSLRGVLVKMIAEYSRHAGHADLLREALDGRTGY